MCVLLVGVRSKTVAISGVITMNSPSAPGVKRTTCRARTTASGSISTNGGTELNDCVSHMTNVIPRGQFYVRWVRSIPFRASGGSKP